MKHRIICFFLAFILILTLFPAYSLQASAYYADYFSPGVTLSGDWKTDIVEVAKAHNNYKKNDFGYRVYWCAYFVSDCARAANIDQDVIPSFSCCTPTVDAIRKGKWGKGVWHDGHLLNEYSTYSPQAGDLVFYSWDHNYPNTTGDAVDHVGLIIAPPVNGYLQVIEGNTTYGKYSFSGSQVCIYTNNYRRRVDNDCVVGYFTPNYCTHSYSSGHCTKCGVLQPLQTGSAVCDIGVYMANAAISLHSDPYEKGVNGSDNCTLGLVKGAQIMVESAVINGLGNKWYKVSYGNNTGYVYAQTLTFLKPISATISCSSLSVPTNHKAGNGFWISGTITTNGCKITKARGYFVRSSTGQILSNLVTPWYTINSNSYSLNRSSLDNSLHFGSLSAGSYYYCIEVQTDKAANGKTTHTFSSPVFTVGSVVIPTPSVWESGSSVGSKTYTISGSGTVYYRVNDGNWIAGTSVTVYESSYLEAKSVSGNYSSGIIGACISVPQIERPSINSTMNSKGSTIQVSAVSGATIYYRINSGGWQRYTGAFTVTNACTVSAYAAKSGCKTSDTASANVTVTAPKSPSLIRDAASDIADGEAMTVHWANDVLAASYDVTVKKDGEVWKTGTVSAPQYSFATNGPGEYSVSVIAKNVIGSSAVSNTVSCTAHAPSTVTFEDYDGTVLSVQTVRYGYAATKPSTPTRRGYTFSGWSDGYSNVRTDLTITAEYEINHYYVKFYDVNGTTLLTTQEIIFDESIDSEEVEPLVSIENGGRVFSGWYIMDAADDSYRDLEHIDSNMKLRAVTVWGNENLPVYVDNISARLCYDNNNSVFNGYTVSCRVSTYDARDINAKIIVTLLAETDPETGACKMINTKVDTINLTSSMSNKTWTGDILCDGTSGADYVEISVVSVEGNDRTGGLISETKRYTITSDATRFWSEWMTADELASCGHSISDSTVEHKVQYSDRHNTKNTISSSSPTPPAGYSLQSNNSYWGGWSGWSDTAVSSSSTRQVETRQVTVSQGYTEYRYGSWYNGSRSHFCGAYYSGLYLRYTDWSTTQYAKYSGDSSWQCPTYSHYTNGKHIGYSYYDGTRFYWAQWKINGKDYYWEESRWIDTSYNKTQYRYRDWVYSYVYYKWDYGNWSEWTDNVLTDNNLSDLSYEVKTRDMYRYVIFDASLIEPNTTGTTQSINGQLEDANTDLNGRLASIFVYKSLNSDPTESQLEYVGQTTLGENGTYDFTFTTKEPASVDTGDFVIALAVEGGDGLINVGMVKYERPTYTVTFATESGTISTQEVEAGGSASAPEAPEKEGYTFTGWSRSTTNVTKNLTVVAQYKPKDCCVVFVDYLNQSCELRHFDYGTVLSVPESMDNPTHEGYSFEGWSYGDDATVTGDMIVSALWEIETYNVTFYDETGTTVVSTQVVPYGGFATPPEDVEVSSDKVFLAWSDDNPWWNVTSDISVYPVVMYKTTAAAPISNIQDITEGLYEELTLTAEDGATILYTLDGSEPNVAHEGAEDSDETTFVYSEPLVLTEDTLVRAKAISAGKNDSETIEVLFIHSEELSNHNDRGEMVDLITQDVNVSEFDKVSIQVDLTSNPNLAGYGFYIKADPSVFFVDFDYTTLASTAVSGTLCSQDGALLIEDYDEMLGWHVIWIGEASSLASGSLLNIALVAGAETATGSYPITVGYTTGETFGADSEPVSIEAIAGVSFEVSGHEHTYGVTSITATCTSAGEITYACWLCGQSYSEPIGPTHNYTAIVTDPTCTEPGFTMHTCTVCNDSYIDSETPALGHAWNDGEVTDLPTATRPGVKTFTCSRCNVTRTETIPATGQNYFVQFNANGGNGTMEDQVIPIDTYENLTANAFTRIGYSFNGWNTAADGSGAAYTNGMRVKNLASEGIITLYAQWKPNSYIVRYNANGGAGALENQKATYDAPFVLRDNTFTRTGYSPVGWNTATDGSGTAYDSRQLTTNLTDAAAITLYAQWMPNTYTIVFNANGGTGEIADQQMTYGVYSSLTQNEFTRTGYTFDGWNTAKDGSGTAYADKRTVRNLATEGTVTLYAQWTRNSYTILFAANGGTGSASSQKASYNLPIALTANAFTRTGYTFNGWNTEADGSGTPFTDRQTVLNLASGGTVKLYAQWKPKTYTIMFVTNGGTGSTISQKTSYDLATELTLNTFTRTGYSFYRWNTAADGTGSYYTDGQTVKNLAVSGTFKLYAQWKPNKYTVTFNANGGTGTMVDQSMTYNTSAALRANTYTKTGYTFTSWNTAPDGSGTSYTNGKTVRNLATEGTVTLYAQWKANTITVRFYPGGGTGSMSNQVMTYDVPAALSANAFYRDGYTFAGWKTGSGVIYTDGQVVENLALKGVVNLYAQWTR